MMAASVPVMKELKMHPARNRWNPKKVGAQLKLIAKCTNHNPIKLFLTFVAIIDDDQILDTASPIHVYKVVQTGAKTLSGGFHVGNDILRYHPPSFVALTTNGTGDAPATT